MFLNSLPDFLPEVTPGLYIVATPIGNRGDISLRALSVLQHCDIIYCEDTRVSRKLMDTYGIRTPLSSYHDHNAAQVRPKIIQKLEQAQKVALISDAGTPLIADPGYKLVQACYDVGIVVTTIPGPSSVISALVISGMPTHPFMFCGFVDPGVLASLKEIPATLVFFEAPHRLISSLETMIPLFQDRTVAVVREITKIYESVWRGSFDEVLARCGQQPVKGEVVIVLSPPSFDASVPSDQEIDEAIQGALKDHSLRDACTLVSGMLGIPRKKVYQRALHLTKI